MQGYSRQQVLDRTSVTEAWCTPARVSARAARAQPECPGSARRPLERLWLSTLISAQPAPALAGRQARHDNAAVAPRCHLQQYKSQQTSFEVRSSKCKSMPKTRSGCLCAAQHSGVLALPGTELSSAAEHRQCLDGTRALPTGLSGYGWDPKTYEAGYVQLNAGRV